MLANAITIINNNHILLIGWCDLQNFCGRAFHFCWEQVSIVYLNKSSNRLNAQQQQPDLNIHAMILSSSFVSESVFTDHTLAHPLNCRGGVVARLSA